MLAYQPSGSMPGEIRVIDVETRAVLSVGNGSLPTWTTDHTLIVEDLDPAMSAIDPWNRVELGSVDAAYALRSGIARSLPAELVSSTSSEPEYAPSPDGTRIAFVGRGHNGTRAVFVADLDGRHRVRIGPSEPFTSRWMSPAWSPDGTRIVYVGTSRDSSAEHVYVVDLATREPHGRRRRARLREPAPRARVRSRRDHDRLHAPDDDRRAGGARPVERPGHWGRAAPDDRASRLRRVLARRRNARVPARLAGVDP